MEQDTQGFPKMLYNLIFDFDSYKFEELTIAKKLIEDTEISQEESR